MTLGYGMPYGSTYGGTHVTFDDPVFVSGGDVARVSWTPGSSAPNYEVFLNGEFFARIAGTEIDIPVPPGGEAVVEVIDCPDAVPQPAFNSSFHIGWFLASDSAKYRIEENVSGQWVVRRRFENLGEAYRLWQSRILEDVSTHQFRLIGVGADGNETTLSLSALMVRHPDTPSVSYAYDGGTNKVTVSAA